MEFITLVGAISSVATLLSIIFDVPKAEKIPIGAKSFILIISIVTAMICFFGSCQGGLSSKEINPTAPTYSNTAGQTITPSPSLSPAPSPEPSNSPYPSQTIHVDSIVPDSVTVSPLTTQHLDVSEIYIDKWAGCIYQEKEYVDYEFWAENDGTHRFEFSDVPDGTDFRLYIYNSGQELIKSDYDLDNGDGLTIDLLAGCLYYLRVEQYHNTGSYVLNVGAKKPQTDISVFSSVSDSVQYSNQKNDYSFTAKVSGNHRLEFSDVPNGTDFRLSVYNSGWELIKSDYDLDNGDGLTVDFQADHLYYFQVEQYRNLGPYTLNVGEKKPEVNILGNISVSDSTQYTSQENDYKYTAKATGTHRFEFSGVPDGTDFRLNIYNSGWELIKSDYDLDEGDGLTVSLNEGESYYLRVSQYRNIGQYTLNAWSPKVVVDISEFQVVTDSIQYANQENDYSFCPKADQKYTLKFFDVPEGTDLGISIYNSGWERLDSSLDMDDGDCFEVSLSKGKTYFVRVSNYHGYGSYALHILQNNG